MSFKKVIMFLAVGFTTGVVFVSSVFAMNERTAALGGELCFLPMVGLLIWFGWTLRTETKKVRRYKNENTRGER